MSHADNRPARDVLRVETEVASRAMGWLKLAIAAIGSILTESASFASTHVRVVDVVTGEVLLDHRHHSPAGADDEVAYINEFLDTLSVDEFRKAYGLDTSS